MLTNRSSPWLISPWLLVAVVWLAFFWQLGTPPLYDLDEGAFTEATREMLASGNYITPFKDGKPRYDKPVLIYWAQAISVSIFGLSEFALRLPSALAAALWVLALWRFARQHDSAATATVASLMMTLSLIIGLIGKAAVADALLNLFIALTLFDIYRYIEAPPTARSRLLLSIYAWMGLGFLTKGPVAIVLPLLISLLYCLSRYELRLWWRAVWAPRGWLVLLLIAAPWYLAILIDNGLGFFASFFLTHNLGRFGGVIHGHRGFAGYYLLLLPLLLLPFSGWLLRLVPDIPSLWENPLDRFLLLWFGVVLIFFSFSSTKLPHYMVYGLTPIFLLMARERERLRHQTLAFIPPLLLLLLLLLLPEWLWLAQWFVTDLYTQALLHDGRVVIDGSYRLALVVALMAIIGLWQLQRGALWQRLIVVGMVQLAVVSGVLVPRVLEVIRAPVKEAALIAQTLDLPTVVYRTSMPSFSLYRQAITPDRPPRSGDLVFLRIDKLQRLQQEHPGEQLQLIYQRGGVVLVNFVASPKSHFQAQ